MTPIQKQFFALVQSGLWGTPVDTTLFNIQTDWAQLYQSAKVQALLGITFDGMQTLPQELRPKRELYLKWCNALLQIEENNCQGIHALSCQSDRARFAERTRSGTKLPKSIAQTMRRH